MCNILVVEDEKPLREVWDEGLNHYGFVAHGFEKAEDALDEAKARRDTDRAFRLAIVDLNLPTSGTPYSTDHLALPRELKQKFPDLLVIVVSAKFRSEYDRVASLQLVDRYLVKGALAPAGLEAEIRALLRIHLPPVSPEDPVSPIFLFQHSGLVGGDKEERFSYNTALLELIEPSGAKVPGNALRTSDHWLLYLFLSRPNEILRYTALPAKLAGRPIPSSFVNVQSGQVKPLAEAVSRLRRVLDPSLSEDLRSNGGFLTNHHKLGYRFNAVVSVQ